MKNRITEMVEAVAEVQGFQAKVKLIPGYDTDLLLSVDIDTERQEFPCGTDDQSQRDAGAAAAEWLSTMAEEAAATSVAEWYQAMEQVHNNL